MAAAKTGAATWIGIGLVTVTILGGAGAWAVAEHDRIEARAEARVLRYWDQSEETSRRLEEKIDLLIERLIPPA